MTLLDDLRAAADARRTAATRAAAALLIALEADWRPDLHPRGDRGRFRGHGGLTKHALPVKTVRPGAQKDRDTLGKVKGGHHVETDARALGPGSTRREIDEVRRKGLVRERSTPAIDRAHTQATAAEHRYQAHRAKVSAHWDAVRANPDRKPTPAQQRERAKLDKAGGPLAVARNDRAWKLGDARVAAGGKWEVSPLGGEKLTGWATVKPTRTKASAVKRGDLVNGYAVEKTEPGKNGGVVLHIGSGARLHVPSDQDLDVHPGAATKLAPKAGKSNQPLDHQARLVKQLGPSRLGGRWTTSKDRAEPGHKGMTDKQVSAQFGAGGRVVTPDGPGSLWSAGMGEHGGHGWLVMLDRDLDNPDGTPNPKRHTRYYGSADLTADDAHGSQGDLFETDPEREKALVGRDRADVEKAAKNRHDRANRQAAALEPEHAKLSIYGGAVRDASWQRLTADEKETVLKHAAKLRAAGDNNRTIGELAKAYRPPGEPSGDESALTRIAGQVEKEKTWRGRNTAINSEAERVAPGRAKQTSKDSAALAKFLRGADLSEGKEILGDKESRAAAGEAARHVVATTKTGRTISGRMSPAVPGGRVRIGHNLVRGNELASIKVGKSDGPKHADNLNALRAASTDAFGSKPLVSVHSADGSVQVGGVRASSTPGKFEVNGEHFDVGDVSHVETHPTLASYRKGTARHFGKHLDSAATNRNNVTIHTSHYAAKGAHGLPSADHSIGARPGEEGRFHAVGGKRIDTEAMYGLTVHPKKAAEKSPKAETDDEDGISPARHSRRGQSISSGSLNGWGK